MEYLIGKGGATILKILLTDVKKYIENLEKIIDGEWGMDRSLDQLIKDNDMPDLYWRVCEELDNYN